MLDTGERPNFISWDQFLRWQEYYNIEPWGEDRNDLRAGALVAALFNCNIDSRKTRPFHPYNYVMGRQNERSGFVLAYKPDESEKNINSERKPLTSPSEWSQVLNMARALNGAYEVKS